MAHILELGTLVVNGEAVVVPEYGVLENPGSKAPQIVDTQDGKAIKWVVVGSKLIADRCLVQHISYFDISNRIIAAPGCKRRIRLDGREYILRLPRVGKREGVPNEWDSALDDVGESNSIWHWHGPYFWGDEKTDDDDYPGYWALRGNNAARSWRKYEPDIDEGCGWRPVLEPVSVEPSPELIGQKVAVWYDQQIIYGQLASYTAYDLYLDRAQTAFLYGCEHDTWYEYQSVMEIVVDRTKIAALQRR